MRPAFKPNKPIDPQLPKAAVRRLFDQAGGVPRVAIALGYRGDSQLYEMADPTNAAEISFAQVAALSGPGSPAAAEYLALLAGGVFVPVTPRQDGLATLTADSVTETAEAVSALLRAQRDGVLTAAEARDALPDLDDAVRAFIQLRAGVAATASSTSAGREPAPNNERAGNHEGHKRGRSRRR